MKSYRYSMWDGTQDISAVDADDLMDAMTDELTSHGDLNQALRNLMRRGMRGNMGSGFEGIRELIERLKQQSRERTERYNLASLVDELKKRLEDILQMERNALDPQGQSGQQGAEGQEGTPGTSGAPEDSGQQGIEFGKGKDSNQCVDAALSRLSGTLMSSVNARVFAGGCLTSATDSPDCPTPASFRGASRTSNRTTASSRRGMPSA